jgi:ComF family protein
VGRRGTHHRGGDAGGRRALSAVGRAVRVVADGALAVLLAPSCAACSELLGEPTRGPVCARCWDAIVPITPPCCTTCGDPLPTWRTAAIASSRCARCRRIRPLLSRACAIGPYEGSLRAIVHALKYGSRQTIARPLAARMRAAGAEILAGADAVIPVPLHPSRERTRGFNQARELARPLDLPLVDGLRRVRNTAAQADLPAARRHANVRGAFLARDRARGLNGAILVLVDDVSTTGATLNACAAALLAAGARDVRAITAARAVARLP